MERDMVATMESLKAYRSLLDRAMKAPTDTAQFHAVVEGAFRLLMLQDQDFAHTLGVSRPTVTRWRNRTNAPHPALRKGVYSWLDRRVRHAMKPPALSVQS